MAMLKHSRVRRERGFTLIETLIALVILSVGLLALAGLISKTDLTTNQSRYMGTASIIASEKLEDFSRLRSLDPAWTAGGNLTSDVAGYSDKVSVSVSDGTFQESTIGDYDPATGSSGAETYTQGPDGVPVPTSVAPTVSNATVFKRRWLVEDSPTGFPSGIKRVTVLVTAPRIGSGKTDSYQMSMMKYGQ
jgi:prepilin-type N-terminal cleavage/methylation domain-containing protein